MVFYRDFGKDDLTNEELAVDNVFETFWSEVAALLLLWFCISFILDISSSACFFFSACSSLIRIGVF
jgi:hypothetical protein